MRKKYVHIHEYEKDCNTKYEFAARIRVSSDEVQQKIVDGVAAVHVDEDADENCDSLSTA